MNVTDHINVVLCKFAYSLMSRVVAFPYSIVTAIVNGEYVICIEVIIYIIIPLYVNV